MREQQAPRTKHKKTIHMAWPNITVHDPANGLSSMQAASPTHVKGDADNGYQAHVSGHGAAEDLMAPPHKPDQLEDCG
jgi:hypothetical protein